MKADVRHARAATYLSMPAGGVLLLAQRCILWATRCLASIAHGHRSRLMADPVRIASIFSAGFETEHSDGRDITEQIARPCEPAL